MTPKPKPTSIEDLLEEHALDPARSSETIRAELKASGVDIESILKRAGAAIGSQVRATARMRATAEHQVRATGFAGALAEFASWPLERVQAWLKDVADGRHGAQFQGLAQPCFRNRSAEEMTEEELRNLAAEIKATMGNADAG